MKPAQPRGAGFTLVEMMVVVTLIAILMALAMPSMSTWIKNSAVRASADALQNGLRMAQAEALRRSRQTVFFLTNDSSPQTGLTAAAGGKYWSINTIKLQDLDTDVPQFIESGVMGSPGNGVQIAGPAAICFNSLGRLAAPPSTGITGGTCTTSGTAPQFDVSLTGADRNLRVTVAVGGQVRMCDPAKTLSATQPDGC